MNPPSPYEPEPMAPAITLTSALLALVILTALFLRLSAGAPTPEWSSSELQQLRSGLAFPALVVDPVRLEASMANHYREADVSHVQEEVDELRTLVTRANLAHFPVHDPAQQISHANLELELTFATDEVFTATGPRGFVVVGEPNFSACKRGLNDLLEAIRSGNLPLTQAVQDPPADRFADYRKYCGNLLPSLLDHHLVAPDGTYARDFSEVMIGILLRYRWAGLAHTRHHTARQLSPYELELFGRWRIEDPDAFSPPERLRLLGEFAHFLPPEYDVPLARARILASQTSPSQAFAELREAHPDVPLYHELYRQAQQSR
jgi:hypothetical protein